MSGYPMSAFERFTSGSVKIKSELLFHLYGQLNLKIISWRQSGKKAVTAIFRNDSPEAVLNATYEKEAASS